jgi:hypothetical protein
VRAKALRCEMMGGALAQFGSFGTGEGWCVLAVEKALRGNAYNEHHVQDSAFRLPVVITHA